MAGITNNDTSSPQSVEAAAAFIQKQISGSLQPVAGIICGSGLGGLADTVLKSSTDATVSINYRDIPYFPQSTVEGHAGQLVIGKIGAKKVPVVIMKGRVHFYEGHSIKDTTFPVRVMKALGISSIIVSNAAGALNDKYRVGDIVVLSDHLNLAGLSGINPLIGPNFAEFGVRFPALSDAYDLGYRRLAHQTWKSPELGHEGRELREGVYAFVTGPSYETRAECRMLRALGADLVGMSTVPEVIVARHAGLKVLAMSLVTNCSVLDPPLAGSDPSIADMTVAEMETAMNIGAANHAEVMAAGAAAAQVFQKFVAAIIDALP